MHSWANFVKLLFDTVLRHANVAHVYVPTSRGCGAWHPLDVAILNFLIAAPIGARFNWSLD